MMNKFDATEHVATFIRCLNNQLRLMELCYLEEADGYKGTERHKRGIAEFHRAQVIINGELEMNGYMPVDMFWFHFKEGTT